MRDGDEIQIIFPAGADLTNQLDHGLVSLTEAIHQIEPDCVAHGFFGGEFGYGASYENEVFAMHPYCWCERHDCPWCAGCSCASNTWVADEGKSPPGVKCPWCSGVHRWADRGALAPDDPPHYGAPHFWHKPSGLRVWWYKYIGRGMETHRLDSTDLAAVFSECVASLQKVGDR